MHLPRLTVVTLGVRDLAAARAFYQATFGRPPNPDYEGVAFFDLPGTWIALYPLDKLAEDIAPDLSPERAGFSGITLACNARGPEEVRAICAQAEAAGARIAKPPQDTFWGGYSGYFSDPDGYYWEVVWAPAFGLAADGALVAGTG